MKNAKGNENKIGRPSKGGKDFNSTVAERIREITNGETQQQIADKIGISRQAVGRIANGENKPDIDSLLKIAQAYNVSADYLLGRSEVKSINITTQGVCEYLGLTEQAVNILAELSKHHSNLSDFIIKHLTAIITGKM